jgi:hypothetical protein
VGNEETTFERDYDSLGGNLTRNDANEARATTSEVGYLGSMSLPGVFKANEHTSDSVWLALFAQVKQSLRTPSNYRVTSRVTLLNLLYDQATVWKTLQQY